jgi:hypothetical protein
LHAVDDDRDLERPEKVEIKEHDEDRVNKQEDGIHLVELFSVPNAHELKKLVKNRPCDRGEVFVFGSICQVGRNS